MKRFIILIITLAIALTLLSCSKWIDTSYTGDDNYHTSEYRYHPVHYWHPYHYHSGNSYHYNPVHSDHTQQGNRSTPAYSQPTQQHSDRPATTTGRRTTGTATRR